MQNNSILSVKGKKIIVTGANGYFGRTFVRELHRLGAEVIAISKSEKIREFLKENKINSIQTHLVDFYDHDRFKEVLNGIIREHKHIDVLINNAFDFSYQTGFNTRDSELDRISDDMYFKGMDAGVYWAFLSSKIIGTAMKKNQNGGSIINISSVYGLVAPDYRLYEGKETFNPATYSMSKSSILALTRYIASFWGNQGIRCNAISPGAFPNTRGNSYNSNTDQDMLKRLSDRTCLGRIGVPEDLMGAVVLLSSDASSYMTGSNIVVDGGWSVI